MIFSSFDTTPARKLRRIELRRRVLKARIARLEIELAELARMAAVLGHPCQHRDCEALGTVEITARGIAYYFCGDHVPTVAPGP